jgi:hypothetical protein
MAKTVRAYSLNMQFYIVYKMNYKSLFISLCMKYSDSPLTFQAIGGMDI